MATSLGPVSELAMLVRFLHKLGPFLRELPCLTQAEERVRVGLERRAETFLATVEHGIYRQPQSPYRRLLHHAGIGLDDIRGLVRMHGVEGTLERLCEAGVYVRLNEFKGRVPIRRGSLELAVGTRDFDNPLGQAHLSAESGGSRGSASRITIDLDSFTDGADAELLFLAGHEVASRPLAMWYPAPPYLVGLKRALARTKLRQPPEHWFSQNRLPLWSKSWRHTLLTRAALLASRLYSHPVPHPEHVPLARAVKVAAWLAEKRRAGTPALLYANVASGVRVCLAAREAGLDIEGSYFMVGGEALTASKQAVFRAVGAEVRCVYAMSEVGRIGVACPHGREPDDVHLMTDLIALIQRHHADRAGGAIGIITLTTLRPTTPKLMLNVETDDYGVLSDSPCGCRFEQLGLTRRLHTIRSWEKLTSDGMNFLGHDLIRLVEEVLPARFGGGPTDWQFIEEEDARGLPKVRLLASPRIGPLEPGPVIDTVVRFLNDVPNASGDFGERWREGDTLELVRAEPHATAASKVLALHVTRPRQEQGAAGARASDRAAAP